MIVVALPDACAVCAFGEGRPTEEDYVRFQAHHRHVPCAQHKGMKMPRPQ